MGFGFRSEFTDQAFWLKNKPYTHFHPSVSVKKIFLNTTSYNDNVVTSFSSTSMSMCLTKKIPSRSEQQRHHIYSEIVIGVKLCCTNLGSTPTPNIIIIYGHKKPGFRLGWGFFYRGFYFPIHWCTALDLQSISNLLLQHITCSSAVIWKTWF